MFSDHRAHPRFPSLSPTGSWFRTALFGRPPASSGSPMISDSVITSHYLLVSYRPRRFFPSPVLVSPRFHQLPTSLRMFRHPLSIQFLLPTCLPPRPWQSGAIIKCDFQRHTKRSSTTRSVNTIPATTKFPAMALPGRGAPTTIGAALMTGADGMAAATWTGTGARTVPGGRATGGTLGGTNVTGGRTQTHDVTLGALGPLGAAAGSAGTHTHADSEGSSHWHPGAKLESFARRVPK